MQAWSVLVRFLSWQGNCTYNIMTMTWIKMLSVYLFCSVCWFPVHDKLQNVGFLSWLREQRWRKKLSGYKLLWCQTTVEDPAMVLLLFCSLQFSNGFAIKENLSCFIFVLSFLISCSCFLWSHNISLSAVIVTVNNVVLALASELTLVVRKLQIHVLSCLL